MHIEPRFRLPPRKYQLANYNKFLELHAAAMFSLPGTGKTKTAIDIICHRYLVGTLTGVLVLSSPKGVHEQWVEKHIPTHIWDNVPYEATSWNGHSIKHPAWFGLPSRSLQFYSLNIDALKSKKSFHAMEVFCDTHQDTLMIIVDESDKIKNFFAQRSRRLRVLATKYDCNQRMIMSGTPIARDLTDEWAQFYFLDPEIIGKKFKSDFLKEYCIMGGGMDQREIIGHRNVEQLRELVEPYTFRADKSELDLPPKVYDEIEFDLTDKQKKMLHDMKKYMSTLLEDESVPKLVRAAHGAAALLRCQQIVNGFTITENEELVELEENPRVDALRELLVHLGNNQVIIWCRFNHDIATVMNSLPAPAVSIYGATPDKDRKQGLKLFQNGEVRYLVASPETAGRGFDGLQDNCSIAIYYSNSFNAVARWQSEDRIHRIGTKTSAIYYDLIARGSPDRKVLDNLMKKKTLSAVALGDIKELIEEIQ